MILPSSQHHPVVIPREGHGEGENRETNNGTFNLVLPGVAAWRCEIRKTLPWRENPYFDLGTGCSHAVSKFAEVCEFSLEPSFARTLAARYSRYYSRWRASS